MKKALKASVYDDYISIAKPITHFFISALLFVLPVAMTNAYYNITETKLVTFYVLSGGYIIAQLFLLLSFIILKGKDFIKQCKIKISFLDVAFILFGVSYVTSSMLSQYGANDVWLGLGSRYQGALTVSLYVLLYFFLTRTFSFSPKCLVWAGVSFSIVSIIAILNGFSIDPLGIYEELSDVNKGIFISTIGNVNFYSAYYNIMLPLLVVGFCKAIDTKATLIFGGFVVAGSLGMVFTASESFLLGFVASMLLLLLFLMDDKRALRRFIASCYLFIFTLAAYTNLYNSGSLEDVLNFVPSGLMEILAKPIVVGVISALLACVLMISLMKQRVISKIKIVYGLLLAVGIVSVSSVIILANTTLTNTDFGAFNDYLKFSPQWGTNRGQNWMFCVEEFINSPTISKVFGFGPETYHNLTIKTGFYETKSLDQAHNEYLQYLISVGILGLISYLSIVAGTIKNGLKSLKGNAVAMSILCGLVAYWVQAIVNIAQPFTTPIMFVFIAILSKLSGFNFVNTESTGAR